MKCNGCLKTTKDTNYLKCSSVACGKNFCSLCINQPNISADKKKTWQCPDCCATQKRGGDNSLTPVRSMDDYVTKRKKTDTTMDTNTNSEVRELVEEVRLLTQEIHLLKDQLQNATISLTACHAKLEELSSSITANDTRIKYLESRDQETRLLEARVVELQAEVNAQAQNQLSNELELAGIPEYENENLHHIALLAAKKVGVDLEDRDLDWVVRAGPRVKSALLPEHNKTFSRPVVVRLLRRNKRDQIIKAARARKNITSADLGVPGTPRKVFYNERLTKINRVLFREARAKCKEFGYSFCWCTHGNILVKQHEGKPTILIRTQTDLLRTFKPPNGH